MLYLALENGDIDEFEFFLAEKLGMTRAELIERIDNKEYMVWRAYYGRRMQEKELAALSGKVPISL